jgi:hypothetical protein
MLFGKKSRKTLDAQSPPEINYAKGQANGTYKSLKHYHTTQRKFMYSMEKAGMDLRGTVSKDSTLGNYLKTLADTGILGKYAATVWGKKNRVLFSEIAERARLDSISNMKTESYRFEAGKMEAERKYSFLKGLFEKGITKGDAEMEMFGEGINEGNTDGLLSLFEDYTAQNKRDEMITKDLNMAVYGSEDGPEGIANDSEIIFEKLAGGTDCRQPMDDSVGQLRGLFDDVSAYNDRETDALIEETDELLSQLDRIGRE